MDRNELKNILREENSSALRSLPPGFYRMVDEYIHELEDEIRKINNPRSAESKILEDELQSAINDVETIFIRRIRKITSRATSNAFSSSSPRQDLDKLLPAEQTVYEATLSAIQVARNQLLEPILDPASMTTPVKKQEATGYDQNPQHYPQHDTEDKIIEQTSQGAATSRAHTEESNVDEPEIPKRNINEEYFVVRILKDLPTFNAVDNRNYTTKAEDVVVLPAMNANVLVKRGAAHLITKINDSN
ncbi:DNA replication complex subunit Gins51 [Methanococcoides sp. FTZ1]|uniref:DNA replication complex subunit Gins51 n=1 Tax=Methanococcoides sp. FTZ1 TaxID=3439061 RepID=UPI003F825CCB